VSTSAKPHIDRYRQMLASLLHDGRMVPDIKQIVLDEYLAMTLEAQEQLRHRHRKQLPAYTGPIPTEDDIEMPEFLREATT
jgi:hypothetical protein